MADDAPNLDLWNEPSPFQNSQAYEQKNHNWDVLRNYGHYLGNYMKGITDGWEIRFAAQLNQIPQPNEVIDARVDAWGRTFPDLHAHLVDIETSNLKYEESTYEGAADEDLSIILKVRDLSTSSSGLSYSPDGTVNEDLPRMGIAECQIKDLAVGYD